MNYDYNEWCEARKKGMLKYLLDSKHIMLSSVIITIFIMVEFIAKKNLCKTRELIFHFIFLFAIFTCTQVVSQIYKWKFMKCLYERTIKAKRVLLNYFKIMIGILDLWLPVGVLSSLYFIHIKLETIRHILTFITSVFSMSILWILLGVVIDIFFIVKNSSNKEIIKEHFIIMISCKL